MRTSGSKENPALLLSRFCWKYVPPAELTNPVDFGIKFWLNPNATEIRGEFGIIYSACTVYFMFLKNTMGVYLIANCALEAKEASTIEKSKIVFFIE